VIEPVKKSLQRLVNHNGLVKPAKTGHMFTAGKKLNPAGGSIVNAGMEEPAIVSGKNLAYSSDSSLHNCISFVLLRENTAKQF